MKDSRKSWERLNEEERKKVKDELIWFFERERDEKIGVIAADEILNFFLQSVGDKLYNQGVVDAKRAVENRLDELRYDLDDLLELERL
jgi:uncharacterized protein (DUF2164 family)